MYTTWLSPYEKYLFKKIFKYTGIILKILLIFFSYINITLDENLFLQLRTFFTLFLCLLYCMMLLISYFNVKE